MVNTEAQRLTESYGAICIERKRFGLPFTIFQEKVTACRAKLRTNNLVTENPFNPPVMPRSCFHETFRPL